MKKRLGLIVALASIFSVALTSCRINNRANEVVKETYMHKYGVPVTKEDWETQGREGHTVALRKDGVTVTTSYANGIVDGPTSYSFPNSSTIHHIDTFSRGVLVSKRENYSSGVPMREEFFEDNALVKLIRWYEDGTPQANEIYQDTFLISGEYRTLLNIVESRISEGQGTRICRSNDGDLLWKDTIQNGQMVERISYYPNSDPFIVTPFENGVVHGTRLTFFQGGLPNTVEQWVHGKQEGVCLVFQNGEKIAEVPYVDGQKNGTELRYRDGHLLVEELNWKDNIQHGQRKFFVDGDTKTEWYHEGELVSRTAYERLNLPRKSI